MRFFRDFGRSKSDADQAPPAAPSRAAPHASPPTGSSPRAVLQREPIPHTIPAQVTEHPAEALEMTQLPRPFPNPNGQEDPSAEATEPQPTGSSRRRIWDLEADEDTDPFPGDPPAATPKADHEVSAEDVAQARLLIAQMSANGGGSLSAEEANKTRILGFRAAELAAEDPFSQSASTQQARGPDFPVGWIVVVSGPGKGASFTLTDGVSSIGRAQDQTICLNFGDNSISRHKHASLAYDVESRSFFLGHGGKSNIVRHNDRPVLSTEDLAHGDKIRLGETTLLFLAFCGADFDWTDPDGEDPLNAATD